MPALTDCRWWFESLLVHSGVSSATRRKATGADHKKEAKLSAKCFKKTTHELFAIEVFADTCRLTASLRQLGLRDSFGFLWSAPVAFRRVALETSEWTSRDSNQHQQSVSADKTNAIPTEPSGRLLRDSFGVDHILAAPVLQLDLLKPECLEFMRADHSQRCLRVCRLCTTMWHCQ